MRIFFALCFLSAAFAQEPVFRGDRLVRPENYREWIFLSSGLGMTYGSQVNPDSPRFDNVFASPAAYKAFKENGVWPEKTILILEVRNSESHGSINTAGHYQTEINHIAAEVKDSSRFKDKWAFFGFGDASKEAAELPKSAGCFACHSKKGAVDNTFVQFYPVLMPIARAKGTFVMPR